MPIFTRFGFGQQQRIVNEPGSSEQHAAGWAKSKLKKIGEMGLAGFIGMFTAAFFLSQAYSLYWAFYIMFSAVAFRLLTKELALQEKSAES